MSNPSEAPVVFRMGKRLYLRPIVREDLPSFVRWFNDPEYTRFLNSYLPMSLAAEEKWFEEHVAKRNEESIVLAVVLRESHRLIGTMGIHRINHRHGTGMTGAGFGEKDCWGLGYGTEAKMLLLEYAFNVLNLRKISAVALAFNVRSLGCMKKCGYQEEGRLRAHTIVAGQPVDEVLMAVFRDDWLPLWEKYKARFLNPMIC